MAADLEGPFDVVTLLIGVNNQFRGGALTEFEAGLASLTDTAIGFADGDACRVLLISIPDWGVTPFAAAAPRAEIAGEIDMFNNAVRDRADKAGTGCVRRAPPIRADVLRMGRTHLPEGNQSG